MKFIGFPRLYAAASLKPRHPHGAGLRIVGFPRLYAAASLKLVCWRTNSLKNIQTVA